MSCLGKIDERAAVPVRHPIIGQTIGNAIAGNVEQQQSTDGQSENPLQALWGGIKQIGGEIVGGVEQVGGAIINGVETVANDVGQGVSSLFGSAQGGPNDSTVGAPPPLASSLVTSRPTVPPPIDSSLAGSPEYVNALQGGMPAQVDSSPVIQTNPDGSKTIFLPVKLTSTDPTQNLPAILSAAQARAAQISGVTVVIEDGTTAQYPITLDVTPGTQNMGGGNMQGEGIQTQTLQGHLDGSRSDLPAEIVHDSLHPEGIDDQYHYVPDGNGGYLHQSNGQLQVTVTPGYENNIMATTGDNGTSLLPSQINDKPAFLNPHVKIINLNGK